MPNTNLFCKTTGSNLNGGGIASGAEPTDAAIATYTSIVAANGWNAATGVFTVAAGNPVTDGVTVGDWASVYVTAGAVTTPFSGRVTARDATTVTVSITIKSGTPPATDATGATTMKVGGAWAGPTGTSMFPWGFMQSTMVNASSHVPRVNIKTGTYTVTAANTHANAGPVTWAGYRTLLTGVTAEADDDIITATGHGFSTGQVAILESGTGFTGLLAEREYYVIVIDANTFRLAATYNLALEGTTYINITVDGSNGVIRAPAKPLITGTVAQQPFVMLLISATRHDLQYLEFATNGFNAGPVANGDFCVQTNSGGSGCFFYRCKWTETYRDGLRIGGGGSMVYECEFNACNVNAGNGYAQLNIANSCTVVRCVAHHSQKLGDAGCPGFGFQAGTGVRVAFIQCIAADNGGQGFWNVTGNALIYFNGCIAVRNGLSGIEFVGNAGSSIQIDNCLFVGNNISAGASEAAIRFGNAGFGAYGFGNGFYNNGANGNFTNGFPQWFQGNLDLTADPFVDSAEGNWELNNTAGGGAMLRNAGAGIFFLNGTNPNGDYTDGTQTFPDVGAAQHDEVPFTAPDPYDVRLGVDNGNGEPGTLTSPAEADVEVGVSYGGDGTEFTGTIVLPAEADVLAGTAYGPGDSLEGSLQCGGGSSTDCYCIKEMPLNQKLDAIYCLLVTE
jgi:hypothetical protein